jgi:DNA-binding SARP family transcriptional activator/tetratricopeptide (TPR) repeat protein
MRFGLLGPVLVGREGSRSDLKSAMPRTVLAVLLLNANAVVSAEQLIEAVWGEHPPASATASLHNHVMRLRRFLGDQGGGRIRSVAPGYVIDVEPGELDVEVFAGLCADGRAAARTGRWAEAAQALAAALALWRGEPVADVSGPVGRDARVLQLVEARLQAREGLVEAELELGRHREVIGELGVLAAQYPLREVFHAQLMLALYRAGRQAEALDVFQSLRRTLVDELGVEPSASIQELHRQILNADPDLAVRDPAPTPAPAESAAGPRPAARGGWRYQLPADTRVFTGRAHELKALIDLAGTAPGGSEAGMVVISAIDGMGGIGKTALAVHAAHRVRERFPDGQLFLDLHGHAVGLEPMSPGDALDWLLRSLGAAPESIPQNLGERAAYYQDRLAGTRTLIILDNAHGPAQVRPLLPAGAGSLVLVTSRRRLVGLDDAHMLGLDTLSQADAVALLHKVAGPGRVPEHHPAIEELAALCGNVPLAIRVAAARLRHRRVLRIEDVVAQLRDETSRLGRLDHEGDNLSAVFESSYAALPPAEQDLFRRLGLIPGPDIDACAAANLASTDQRTAERLLESLLDHNLLTQHTPGRYRFHDLIRVYAQGLAARDPGDEREAALDRLLDYYQHTATVADRHLARFTRPGPPPALGPPPVMPRLADRAAAIAWMRTERDNLVAALTHARAPRMVSITAALAAFLQQEGPWPQAATLHRAAVAAAQRLGDRTAEANALDNLGRVVESQGDHTTGTGLYERALTLYRDLGSRLGEANALLDLARIGSYTGDFPRSAALLEQSESIFDELGDRLGVANALREQGHVRHMAGDFPPAIDLLERSLAGYQDLDHGHGVASALWDLGRLKLAVGDFRASAALHEQALARYRELGNRLGEAVALDGLGRARAATGDYPAAAELLGQALAVYQDIGNRVHEAYALWSLGRVRLAAGDLSGAAGLADRSLAVFQELGHRQGQANALHGVGRIRLAAGDLPAAAQPLERSLALFRELGDVQGEAEVLISCGALAAETAGPDEAVALYRKGLILARQAESRLDEAHALAGAARCAARTGDRPSALADLREAVAIYRRIGAAEAVGAATELAALERSANEG